MWRDTPQQDQILAERLDGQRVRFSELRCGEVVRLVAPDGRYIDPAHEPSEDFFRVCSDPEQADGTQGPQDYGWCVVLEEIEAGQIRAGLN